MQQWFRDREPKSPLTGRLTFKHIGDKAGSAGSPVGGRRRCSLGVGSRRLLDRYCRCGDNTSGSDPSNAEPTFASDWKQVL